MAKAKAVRPFAEKMITLGKRGDLHRRSTSLACCRLCDRLLNLQRLRLLKRFCRSRDLAIAIQGPAGAGKTTFAAEAVRAIEALSGKDVMVLAPSSSAVNELRSRVTPKAETIQQFMINPELQDAARGGVLRIDEASFLSARAGRWLLEFARDSGTRLVVPGDVRQHHSVERGDWLRLMNRRAQSVTRRLRRFSASK